MIRRNPEILDPWEEFDEEDELSALSDLADPYEDDGGMLIGDLQMRGPSMEIGEMIGEDDAPNVDIGDLEVLAEAEGDDAPNVEIGELEMDGPSMEIGEMYDPSKPRDDVTQLDELAITAQPPPVPPPQGTSTYADDVVGPSGVAFNVPDTRKDMDALLARTRELYAQQEAGQQPAASAEREWRAMNQRPTQDDFRRAWLMRMVDEKGSAQMLEMLQGQLKYYDSGLAQARALDQKEVERTRRVDPGMAELLVLAGMSPESAARAKAGDPSTQLARSLGALGIRLRGQEQALLEANLKATSGVQGQQSKQSWQGQQNELQRQNNLDVAAAQKKGAGGGGGGGGLSDEAIANALAPLYKKPADQIMQVLSGQDVPGISPEVASAIKSSGFNYRAMGGEKRNQFLKSVETTAGTEGRKAGVAWAVKQADPVMNAKHAARLSDLRRRVNGAYNSWHSLSDAERRIVLGAGTNPKIAEAALATLSPAAQTHGGRVWRFVNKEIKELSGANVTESESPRLQRGFSAALTDTPTLFAAPENFSGWLQDLEDGSLEELNIWTRSLGPQFEAIVRGGR